MTKKIIRFGWKLTNRIQSNKWDKNLWYFIYWEKRSSVTYLWVTSMWISRIRIWRRNKSPSVQRWFQLMGWLSGVSSCPDLFKEQGSIKSAHVCGSASWFELRRSLRISEKELLLAGKGYKTISKEFGLHKVRQFVYKWRKFKTSSTQVLLPKNKVNV